MSFSGARRQSLNLVRSANQIQVDRPNLIRRSRTRLEPRSTGTANRRLNLVRGVNQVHEFLGSAKTKLESGSLRESDSGGSTESDSAQPNQIRAWSTGTANRARRR